MKHKMQQYVDRIEGYLSTCFLEDEPQKVLFDSMRYSLLAGGKRIRPVLVQAFCELCGGDVEACLPFAAAIEMVHTYSLIHDDLPSMDNDDFRRGKPTNHRVYGEATAILAGDGLLTAAFSHLAKAKLPAQRIVQAVDVLSHCAGELGMVGGQILDMAAEERLCTEQEVIDIQIRKTGGLIEAACKLGAIASGATQQQIEAADTYARCLGLAFQIRDDILDVIGDAQALGKATGVDEHKNTFVRLYGVAACEEKVHSLTKQAVASLSGFEDASFLSELAKKLADRFS